MCVPGGPGQYDRGGGSDLKTGPLGQKGRGERGVVVWVRFFVLFRESAAAESPSSLLLFPGESWGFWTCCCVEGKVFLEGGREEEQTPSGMAFFGTA